MTDHNTARKISRLIKARYPIVAIQSHEENRVQDHIMEIAKTQEKRLYTWTVSNGLVLVSPLEDGKTQAEGAVQEDPVEALQEVIKLGAPTEDMPMGEPAIFLFKDLHPYCTGERSDPVVIRALRDVASILVKRRQTLLLLSPQFVVPPDAEKDIAIVDFPLPSAVELAEQLDGFVDNLPESIHCDLNGGRERIIRALQGLSSVEADAVLAQAVIALRHLGTDAIPFILQAKAEIIRKSGALEYYAEQAMMNDIGGLDLLKNWCRESEVAFSDKAAAFGVEPDKGLLIVGVPGCGKSLTAKAVAGGTRPLLRLDVGALFGSLVGQSESQTRNALKIAEAVAPCILWIDEIEKGLGGSGGELDGGTSTRVLGTILTWLEETEAPVFVVATANDIGTLRPELIRRFSETFFVDLPQTEERVEILAIHLAKRGRSPESFDLAQVVLHTDKFTGSELEKVVQGALRTAFAQGKAEIETADLVSVAKAMVPLATTMEASIKQMRDWSRRARPASSRQTTASAPQDVKRIRAIEM